MANDIRETDNRINQTEQELRSELVVHVTVQGTADIGSVPGFTLLLEKIERNGRPGQEHPHLTEHGVSLAHSEETERLLEERQQVSAPFAEAGDLMAGKDATETAVDEYADRALAVAARYQGEIESFMTSDRPGREFVPLAIHYRYLRRIVANPVGIVRTSSEPLPHVDCLEGGTVDTDD